MISTVTYRKLKAELEELEADEENARRSVDETAAAGDLRENEPFQIAKQKFIQIVSRIQEIKALLSEEVQDSIGHSLSLGRLLKITYLGIVDDHQNVVESAKEEMLLMFDTAGDPVVDGILSKNSELGRSIEGGREGIYVINMGNVFRMYDVRLYTGDVEEYFRRFPVSKKEKVTRLLRGEFV